MKEVLRRVWVISARQVNWTAHKASEKLFSSCSFSLASHKIVIYTIPKLGDLGCEYVSVVASPKKRSSNCCSKEKPLNPLGLSLICISLALLFASCKLFINAKPDKCLGIHPVPSSTVTGRAQRWLMAVGTCADWALQTGWWGQSERNENTAEGFHLCAPGKSSSYVFYHL